MGNQQRQEDVLTGFSTDSDLECAFAQVLDDLGKAWPTSDIAYVRDIVAHAEYGEALETLIAIGVSNGHGFGAGQLRRLEAIGAMMRLNVATLLETARAQYPSPASTAA